jgi:hypothetical protein
MTDLHIDDDEGSRRKTNMKDTEESRKKNSFFEPILEISFSTIASGATTIGSAGRAPDDVFA